MLSVNQYQAIVPLLKFMKFSQALEFTRRIRVQTNLREDWFDNESRAGRMANAGLGHYEGAKIMLDCLDREF